MYEMKKLLLILLVLLSLSLPAQAFRYTHEGVELEYTQIENSNNVAVSAPVKTLTTAPIPATVTNEGITYTVTEIAADGFRSCTKLTNVSIPNTVTTINSHAFNSSALTTLDIPNSVTSLGDYFCSQCTKLQSVNLSNAVKILPLDGFSGCTGLVSIVIPVSVTQIGGNMLYNCTSLKDIYIGPNVTNISYTAFGYVTGNIHFSRQTPATIHSVTFTNFKGTIYVPENCGNAYKNASNWPSPQIVEGTQMAITIDDVTYSATSNSTESVVIPFKSGATKQFNGNINSYLGFTEGSNYINWSSSDPETAYVETTGEVTLKSDPTDQAYITAQTNFPSSSPFYRKIIFYLDTGLKSTDYSYTIIDAAEKKVSISGANKALEVADIPATISIGTEEYTVTTIASNAFVGFSSLHSVTIPNTVTTLGANAFSGCTALKNVTLSTSLTNIGAYAFYNCALLEKITIPNSVTTIESSAFSDCASLESIIIPNSVTSLGLQVFRNCSNLASVQLSSSLTIIPQFTFAHCSSLREITLPPSINRILQSAFINNTSLETIYIGPNINISNGMNSASIFAGSNLKTVYITTPTPPALESSCFPNTIQHLYVQGQDAKALYEKANYWKNFPVIETIENPAEAGIKMVVERPHGQYAPQRCAGATPMRADVNYNTTDHIYTNTVGETLKREATLRVGDTDEAVPLAQTFWSSDNPSQVYVEHDGTITIRQVPSMSGPVALTASSLYADGPTHTIRVDNYLMTDVDEIMEEDNHLDADAPARIYTLDGLEVGQSLNGLSQGIYIVKQGRKTVKITVR